MDNWEKYNTATKNLLAEIMDAGLPRALTLTKIVMDTVNDLQAQLAAAEAARQAAEQELADLVDHHKQHHQGNDSVRADALEHQVSAATSRAEAHLSAWQTEKELREAAEARLSTVQGVFEKFSHLDELLSDERWIARGEELSEFRQRILSDLWQAVKAVAIKRNNR